MRSIAARSWDNAFAGLAALAIVTEALLRAETSVWPGAYLLAVVAAGPFAWRGRDPLRALIIGEVGAVACVLALDAKWSATAIVFVLLYTVARQGDRQRSVVIGAATSMVVLATIVLIDGSLDMGGVLTRIPLVVTALALGDTVRARGQLRAAAREREEREAADREQESRRRVAQERLRIARELHDTLAHALVAINVRAGVAERLGASQNPAAAFGDIKDVSATALGDLRSTLTLLREPSDGAPTGPVYDLEAIPKLIDHARATGLRADLELRVDGARVPWPVGQAAFRTVQEALTNVVRHAHASRAHVTVRTVSDALDIEVVDDGRAAVSSGHSGLGLQGMGERAVALGGSVRAGPCKDGGWRVHAVLPLDGKASQ